MLTVPTLALVKKVPVLPAIAVVVAGVVTFLFLHRTPAPVPAPVLPPVVVAHPAPVATPTQTLAPAKPDVKQVKKPEAKKPAPVKAPAPEPCNPVALVAGSCVVRK